MSELYLKIKIISLADEARTIRSQEKTLAGDDPRRWGMRQHRVEDVRREARAALLAYGYLRGRNYRSIEATCYRNPLTEKLIKRVTALVNKYGPATVATGLPAWFEEPAVLSTAKAA